MDMKSFGLLHKDAQSKDDWRLRMKEAGKCCVCLVSHVICGVLIGGWRY